MPLLTTPRAMLAAALLACASASQAQTYAFRDAALPDNAYITFGGLQWAWANPVAADGSFVDYLNIRPGASTGIDLSYQAQFGWRLPTADELAHAPMAYDFIFAGANVPAGGPEARDPVSRARNNYGERPAPYEMACAAPYFSNWSFACNYGNAPGSGDPNETVWWGTPGAPTWAETVVVRGITAPVPEPTTWALMIFGLGAVAAAARRRKA